MLEAINSAIEALKTKPDATRAERIAANFPNYVAISFTGRAHIVPKEQIGCHEATGWCAYIMELPRQTPDHLRASKKFTKDFFRGYDEAKNLFNSVG